MRLLYTTVFTLMLPLVLGRLYWRGVKAPAYRSRWLERLGFYGDKPLSEVIWIHAVSVGEAEAAFPLIKHILKHYPNQRILVTTTTPTGSARVLSVLQDSVQHVYFPYDLPWIVRRSLNTFKPTMLIIMEKEIWPNLFAACSTRKIPLYIVNARLSSSSAALYKMISPLIKPALCEVNAIIAQSEEDAQNFNEIGSNSDNTHVAGNIKFDIKIEKSCVDEGSLLKRSLFPGRFVWIVASTHEGEEDIFLSLYSRLKLKIPELILLLVPRHPERFNAVKTLAEQAQLKSMMRTGDEFCKNETDVYIADTLGELKMLYATADIAFVGGSMVPVGGHNVLEPLAVGVPVLFGPEMTNFKEIARQVLSDQTARQCQNEEEIIQHVLSLYENPQLRKQLISKGQQFIHRNQGVTQMVFDFLKKNQGFGETEGK